MAAEDISRYLFQPGKRYSGVRMQQGRVILDSDWNESETLDDEDARRTLVDIVCGRGTSNNGFHISAVEPATVTLPAPPGGEIPPPAPTVQSYDFSIGAGSFYLGGLRFESDGEQFLRQSDWLQIDVEADDLPVAPPAGELVDGNGNPRPRHDLVYLAGWEQGVTAVEDSELREVALGGPDSGTRRKRRTRVAVLTDVPGACPGAFAHLRQRLVTPRPGDTSGIDHAFDARGSELLSKALLTVGFGGGDPNEDPCRPAVAAGFIGADNQTLRVQLTAANRLIWGYDNASPPYRVQIEAHEGALVRVKFLTLPRDQAAQPLAGQAVEILPWGALLPNAEKVAELQGFLSTVATSFDPETATLTLAQPVPSEWLAWLDAPEHADFLSERDPPGQRKYLYLKLWTGGSGDAAAPDHAFTPGSPLALAGTGLTVEFSDFGLPGDHWIIAARPNTPDRVVPWELLSGAPPAGPRLFFAPLALVRWSATAPDPDGTVGVRADVHDCRGRFRPLCEVGGCCTFTVGDGVASHGDFGALQAAVDALPAVGGEVCLLPGVHVANVDIRGRRSIRIHGCGRHTVLIPGPERRLDPIFRVSDSRGISVEHMDMVSLGGTAIVLAGSRPESLQEITIAHCRILACEQAIRCEQGTGIRIHHNHIRMLDRAGAGEAVLTLAEDGRIERNDIGVVPAGRVPPPEDGGDDPPRDPTDPCAEPEILYGNLTFLVDYLNRVYRVLVLALPTAPFQALGGIRIAAGSERVAVLDNCIIGGAGNGITLGGGIPVAPDPDNEPDAPALEHAGGQLFGVVESAPGAPLAGVSLALANVEDGTSLAASTASGGGFVAKAAPGRYRVVSTSPGLRIDSIAAEDGVGLGRVQRLRAVSVQRDPPAFTAFLYEIRIEANEIARMGLSGIGFPPPQDPAPRLSTNQALAGFLARFGNPLITLGIHRNHIHDCLQNPFDDALRAQTRQRGLGGVSLGYVEDLSIGGNRIEHNGRRHLDPVCGVFIMLGEEVEIHHNRIVDNGPAVTGGDDLTRGRRGGIVAMAAALSLSDLLGGRDRTPDSGRHALRVHDNVVRQPAGQALTLLTLGPTSIAANHLAAERTGPEPFERLAGAVLIANAGRGPRLPAGLTRFDGNQTWLGPASTAVTAQFVWSLDDLGFDANQSLSLSRGLALTDSLSLLINTVLFGQTARATDSRFKEPPGARDNDFLVSLMTRTERLNNTNDNQGDHCIFALNLAPGVPADSHGNQVIDAARCRTVQPGVTAPAGNFAVFTQG